MTIFASKMTQWFSGIQLVTRIAEAFVVDVFAGSLERSRLWQIAWVGIAEGQNREDVPAIGDGKHLLDQRAIEIADPASAKAEAPGGSRHILDGLAAVDIGPAGIGDIFKDDNRRRGVGDKFSGAAACADLAQSIAILNHDELPGLLVACAHGMATGTDDLTELFRLNGLGGEIALYFAALDRFQNVQWRFS